MARHRSTGIICLGFWLNEGGVECEACAFTPSWMGPPTCPPPTHSATAIVENLSISHPRPGAFTYILVCCCCFSLSKDHRNNFFHWCGLSVSSKMFSRALTWFCEPALTNQYLLQWILNGAFSQFYILHHLAPDGNKERLLPFWQNIRWKNVLLYSEYLAKMREALANVCQFFEFGWVAWATQVELSDLSAGWTAMVLHANVKNSFLRKSIGSNWCFKGIFILKHKKNWIPNTRSKFQKLVFHKNLIFSKSF